MYTILQCIHAPITKYYSLSQSVPRITMCIPYYKVHTLLQNVSYNVYPLLQSVAPIEVHILPITQYTITKYTLKYKVYSQLQSILPIMKCKPYFKKYVS